MSDPLSWQGLGGQGQVWGVVEAEGRGLPHEAECGEQPPCGVFRFSIMLSTILKV